MWILGDGGQKVCRISEKEKEGLKKEESLGRVGDDSGNCLTSWSQNIAKKEGQSKTELWIRARSEDNIKNMIGQEPIMGDLWESQNPELSSGLNIDFLKKQCDFRNEEGNKWVIVSCPKKFH
ncbi:hypothetical protein [Mycoplasma suis]|uniref:Uncharacterized protein n=1 Tax=Mycoplasma suis (strain Illinois) TaxID=768700 RepID=F0QRT3_MYCSL|nr:hypothetical protein [Mycoplasma suis]ADX98203.1 hypothetical protein MSU_0672 [Mycoplasma suis str. Illinois]